MNNWPGTSVSQWLTLDLFLAGQRVFLQAVSMRRLVWASSMGDFSSFPIRDSCLERVQRLHTELGKITGVAGHDSESVNQGCGRDQGIFHQGV